MRSARAGLVVDGVRARVAPPPDLPKSAQVGVSAVLSRSSPTCLERSVVLQAWFIGHGIESDIVVGVPRTGQLTTETPETIAAGFSAHAWLALEESDKLRSKYVEIYRIPPQR